MSKATHIIIGGNARDLKIITLKQGERTTYQPRFSGTAVQCQQVLKESVRQWHDLPKGKEIEETAARVIKPDLNLVPDELEDRTAPADPPAKRRRRAGEETVVIIAGADASPAV